MDGILPADRSDQVRAHLDACPDCEQERELLRAVTAPLTAWGDMEPPAGCFERILARIEALPPEVHVPASRAAQPSLRFLRGGARWLVTSGVAAAAVLVAAAALERAGDVDTVRERPSRVAPALAGVSAAGMGAAGWGGTLRPGEIPLTRMHFAVTEDMEQRDGLRRRSQASRADRARGLAVPVSVDPLGAGSR